MKYILTIFCAMTLIFCFQTQQAEAQNKLNNRITILVKQVKLSTLLDTLAKKNGFYFSYSNEQIRADSVVSLSVHNQSLRTVLDTLFKGNVDYKESPGYVILRSAPHHLTMQAEAAGIKEQSYYISGYVLDERSGLGIPNASVYEKRLLVATLTDQKGFIKIRLKSSEMVTLTVSKEYYKDASVNFLSNVTISLKPENAGYDTATHPSKAEKSWLGKIFISSAQRIQSANLGGYFATVPFQTSFTPGLSSHGMMSSQVVNHFSINALGGYTAGLDGVELGGLFNISKQDVRFLQVAGLFNVVGGNFSGVQLAGIGNSVLKNVDGLQLAGLYNLVKDSVKGVQIAGIFNKARVMNGFSFGLVNIADTLNGYAVGLLNLSRNGYHRIMVYSTDIAPANIAFKTGNQKLYSILSGGINPDDRITYFTVGLGIGHDFVFNDHYSLSAEVSSQALQAAKWDKTYMVNRLSTLMNLRISPTIGFFAGPSFNLYYHQSSTVPNGEQQILKNKPGLMSIGNNKAWFGWTAGFSFF